MSYEDGNLFLSILESESPVPRLDELFPFYPLDAPGMTAPGEDFVIAATQMGDAAPTIEGTGANRRVVDYGRNLHYLYRRALYDENFSMTVSVKGRNVQAQLVPGHLWGYETNGLEGGDRKSVV